MHKNNLKFVIKTDNMIRKIKALFYLLFCGLSVQSQNNTLVVFSESGNPFFLSVNDELINKNARSNIKVFNFGIGWNYIFIKIPNKEQPFKDSIQLSNKSKFLNKEFTYVLKDKEGKLALEFKSVSEQSGPEKPPIPEAPKETVPLVDNSIYGNLYQAVNNKPLFYKNFDTATSTCKIALSDKDINYALTLFKKANDTEAAYRYLNQIIELNCYSVLQLKELLESTPIDMDRLNSAKKAYIHLSDQQNANTLIVIFKYPTIKESFTSFIKEQENIIKQKNMNCKEPIDDSVFEALLSKIKKAPYENEKLVITKKLLVDVCLSSIQARKICNLYTHDREKMELLKSVYNVLTDKNNATALADEFQFKETKEDYLKYISK
jgi:hypothetical protein